MRGSSDDTEFFAHEAFDVVERGVFSLSTPGVDLVVGQFDKGSVRDVFGDDLSQIEAEEAVTLADICSTPT